MLSVPTYCKVVCCVIKQQDFPLIMAALSNLLHTIIRVYDIPSKHIEHRQAGGGGQAGVAQVDDSVGCMVLGTHFIYTAT